MSKCKHPEGRQTIVGEAQICRECSAVYFKDYGSEHSRWHYFGKKRQGKWQSGYGVSKDDKDYIFMSSVAATLEQSKRQWLADCGMEETWEYWQQHGYKTVRIQVRHMRKPKKAQS